MPKIEKVEVSTGIYWIAVEEADLFLLCGSPADTIKHLILQGFVKNMEKEGVSFQSGPNAILLADTPVQNGWYCNLTEFPVLHMLYFQGKIIPNHPNNDGSRPLLIGTQKQVDAQKEYLFRGNYGLISREEMMEVGFPEECTEEMMRIKLNFAFGRIAPSDELLDTRITGNQPVEIKNNVFIQRLESNIYSLNYGEKSILIDLTLSEKETPLSPYVLPKKPITKSPRFGVVHIGEGNGWDVHRPCMASLLLFEGKRYLIDVGPNILYTLERLGLTPTDIDGIFHTHAHDDHFAGLVELLQTGHRLSYHASPLVRSVTAKKLGAMLSKEETWFNEQVQIHDLALDTWSDVEGLEVKAIYSPHPVETTFFTFRVFSEGLYKSYTHLADTVSFDVLQKMTEPSALFPISTDLFDQVKEAYRAPATLKKIDIGGGLIHGLAKDFKGDSSEKIILAHTHAPLTPDDQQIGESASFGQLDILID